MDKDQIQNKAILKKPDSIGKKLLQEFHFAGSGIWHPITVLAEDIRKAEEAWKKARRSVNPQVTDEDIKS